MELVGIDARSLRQRGDDLLERRGPAVNVDVPFRLVKMAASRSWSDPPRKILSDGFVVSGDFTPTAGNCTTSE